MCKRIYWTRFNMDFCYDDLLKRAGEQMPEISIKKERLELPRLFITTVGMRTIISNFGEISNILDRDPQHILKFLTHEMATAATFHDARAIFQGKFQRDSFERLLQRYMDAFVICPVCKRPDTKLVKEKRLITLVCNACGAKSAIKQI
ncbi:MAG: translation initiation factor IF-2 subunit beta [Candidatus Bathyarchaeota archaeon]|nr:translation initiation factor IF-2 subunit beta [Candidatus Termiticorpusculum sp.]